MASAADCSIDTDGNLIGYCPSASRTKSGMFLGIDAANLGGEIPNNLSDFKWDSKDRIVITPTNGTGKYSDLHFKFDAGQAVSGNQGGTGTNPYTITLGTNNGSNRAFLLNVDDKILSSNLRIDFANSQGFTYYLKTGGLKGNLTLKGNGKFIANLLGGITGAISNTGVEATFNITNKFEDLLTTDSITADGGTNNFNFTSARENLATVEVNSGISEENSGKNNFTLDSTTSEEIKLVLKGATNQITSLNVFGENGNTLTLETTATNNSISTLTLGTTTGTPTNGTLNLSTANALIITDLNVAHQSGTLNITQGNVTITNQITTNNGASSTFNIGGANSATLTLTNGFETNGGKNKFVIEDQGTLIFGSGSVISAPLTTTGTGSVTEFDIKSGANFVFGTYYNALEAKDGGKNIVTSVNALTLDNITTSGDNESANIIKIKTLFLTGTLSADTGKNIITLGSGDSSVSGNITETNGGQNIFTLNSTSLTLDGAGGNVINTLKALEGNNKLTITNRASGTNKIATLNLGDSGTAKGFLTIDNSSSNALTIGTLTNQEAGNILTIVTGEVMITNALAGKNNSITLNDNTLLTLNGGNLKSLNTAGTTKATFNSGETTITDGISAGNSGDTNTFTLTSTSGTTSAIFNGSIGGAGANNFKLDSANGATNLTLKGADNAITTVTALGGDATNTNILTIDAGANGTNKIATITLGDNSSGGNITGFLTITNESRNALTIGTFENANAVTTSKNTLTINKGSVNIANNLINTATNFTLDSSGNDKTPSLTLEGKDSNSFTKLTALSASETAMNTLIINTGTSAFNMIGNLVLGDNTGKSGLLKIDNTKSGSHFKIGTITANGKNSTLTLSGVYKLIDNLNLEDGANFNLDAVDAVGAENNGELTINTLESGQNGQFKIDAGSKVIITDGVNTGNKLKIALNGQGAALTLNNTNRGSIIENLTTTGTGTSENADNTINFNARQTTIKTISTSGTNNFNLTSTSGTTSAIFNDAIGGTGTNNFKLNSTNGATALTLNGASNAINTFTALGNQNTLTLENTQATSNTITELVLGDSAKGLLTIANNATTNGSGKVALIIDTLTSNFADSTLTISAGAVEIKNLTGTGENNNIALTGAALTLNGGTLKSLTTTGKNNTINLASGDTTITSGIDAVNGVTNTFTLKGTNEKKTSATFKGNIGGGGTNNFTLDSATLHLKGNSNTITTLTLNNQSNNTINLAGDISKNNQVPSGRADFRLLTIGTSTPSTSTGLLNPNGATLTFESYINPKANNQSQTPFSNKVTLGGEESKADGIYGYAYSDRVIIHNAGENQTQAQGTYNFKAYYSSTISESDLKSIKYTEGGTEVKGNIALFTIAKTANGNQGIIEFGTQDNNPQIKSTTRAGLDAITTTLTQIETDQYGKTNVIDDKNYLTYFVNQIQQGSGNDEAIDIIEDSNLMIQSMAVSAVNLYLANFNSLNKRMGELRDNVYSKGIWARTFIGSQSNNLGLSDQMEYFSLQAGFDETIKTEKANNFIGFAISYSKNFGYSSTKNSARSLNSGGRAPELGIDSLNSQLLEMAFYNSYVANDGWYNDTIGKLSYIQNSMTIKDQASTASGGINGASGKFNTFAFTLSNEVGYRAKLGEDKAWFIDPQAEVAIGYIDSVDFSLNHDNNTQANATISSAINIRARAGASIGYDFKNFTQDKGIDAKVYVGAFYEMDSFHYTDGSKGIKYITKLKDTREVKMLDTDHRAVLNVGTNLTIKEATRLYLDFEKSFGGKITTDYKINAGVRYSFGENVSYKLKGNPINKENESVDSESKAPLKIKEEGESGE